MTAKNTEPKTIEDLLKLVPKKGDSVKLTNGMKVTNNGTYYGFSGKGL